MTAVTDYGKVIDMERSKKITAHVPAALLRRACAATGKGVTETVRLGLGLIAAARAQDELRRLRGKVRLGVDLEKLRTDRP